MLCLFASSLSLHMSSFNIIDGGGAILSLPSTTNKIVAVRDIVIKSIKVLFHALLPLFDFSQVSKKLDVFLCHIFFFFYIS
ncbi:hypothetical protein I7I52_02724 [Histoplasma capsulatum]|uniref:Uncharacterized protein n=1 Tax=Ajellomyces capsulatus TaxID=5037 RepID=A0A8H7Z7X4_AJECA|nr:hypothetical protein I7I52_02724 [Histoplasma capsulatum]